MGLDSVELIMAVEDAFKIHIENEEAEKVRTVGEFYALIESKLTGADTKACLTSAAFYQTRRAFLDALSLERRTIRPSTLLETLVPREGRRQKWAKIQNAMTLELPELEFSRPLWLSLLGIAIFLPVAVVFASDLPKELLMLLPIYVLVLILPFTLVAIPFAKEFPRGNKTVGDLARQVLAINYGRVAEEAGGWNKKDLWESYCQIIERQLGVARDKIVPEARFVDDLGMD